jgi:pilus assembly protein CpaC
MKSGNIIRGKETIVRWMCAFTLLAIIGSGFSMIAAASEDDQAVSILHRQSQILRAPWKVARVAITDPLVADVQVLTPEQILIQGLEIGTTDIILWNEDETQILQKQINVVLDVETLQKTLGRLFPTSELYVSQSSESLVVKGHHKNVVHATQLQDFLADSGLLYMDMTDVSGVQQVQLQVRVAEVSKVGLQSLGVSWLQRGNDFSTGISPGGGLGTAGDILGGGAATLSGSGLTAVGILPRADIAFFLDALAENQYLRLLANPTLVALSGEEAGFLAGGEFPVPVVQDSGGGDGGSSISIEWKEYGVRLMFRPIVLGDGTIRLVVAPEVSELDYNNGTTVNGTSVPGILARKAETTLELNSGQSFAMAGLLSSSSTATNSSIPGMGSLPVIGPLFRSVRYQNKETELMILVTANLVEPLNIDPKTAPMPGVLHDGPSDWELYIDGELESAAPAKLDNIDAQWLKRLGLDELNGPGAWDAHGNPVPKSQAELATDVEK